MPPPSDAAGSMQPLVDTVQVAVRSMSGDIVFDGAMAGTSSLRELAQRVSQQNGTNVGALRFISGVEVAQSQQQLGELPQPVALSLVVRQPDRCPDKLLELFNAVTRGDATLVRELMERCHLHLDFFSDNPDFFGHNKETPLVAACRSGRADIAGLLVRADADVNFGWMHSPLTAAASATSLETVQLLLGARATLVKFRNKTALGCAVAGRGRVRERLAVVQTLLQARADPNETADMGPWRWDSFRGQGDAQEAGLPMAYAVHNFFLPEPVPLRRIFYFHLAMIWFNWQWLPVIIALRAAGARGLRCSDVVEAFQLPLASLVLAGQLVFFAQLGVSEWTFSCVVFGLVFVLRECGNIKASDDDEEPVFRRLLSCWPNRVFSAISLCVTPWLAFNPHPAWPAAAEESVQAWAAVWLPRVAGAVALLAVAVAIWCFVRIPRCRLSAFTIQFVLVALLIYVRAASAARSTWLVYLLVGIPSFAILIIVLLIARQC